MRVYLKNFYLLFKIFNYKCPAPVTLTRSYLTHVNTFLLDVQRSPNVHTTAGLHIFVNFRINGAQLVTKEK